MSRYINADKLIEHIINTADLGGWIGEALQQIKQVAIKYINLAPSIDIVFCDECEYRYTFKCWMRNTQVPRYPNDEDHCSKGCREEKTCDTCKYNGVPSVECDRCDKTSYSRWVSRSEKTNSSTRSILEQVGKE